MVITSYYACQKIEFFLIFSFSDAYFPHLWCIYMVNLYKISWFNMAGFVRL